MALWTVEWDVCTSCWCHVSCHSLLFPSELECCLLLVHASRQPAIPFITGSDIVAWPQNVNIISSCSFYWLHQFRYSRQLLCTVTLVHALVSTSASQSLTSHHGIIFQSTRRGSFWLNHDAGWAYMANNFLCGRPVHVELIARYCKRSSCWQETAPLIKKSSYWIDWCVQYIRCIIHCVRKKSKPLDNIE